MAKIVDPDALDRGEEIIFDTTAKTIQLLVTATLTDDPPGPTSGVTLQAIYSACKDLWLLEEDLNKLKFPFDAITECKMDLVNGWNWKDDQTRQLIRDGGWHAAGPPVEEYACIISLGAFSADTDQAYYQQVAGFNETPVNFDKTGVLNEAIKTLDGATDLRNFLKTFLRVGPSGEPLQGRTYSMYNLLAEQGIAALDYTVYRLPLANTVDIKVTHTDAYIDANLPYTGMTIDFLKGVGFTTWENEHAYPAYSVVQELTGTPKRWFRTVAGGTSDGTDVDNDVGVVWVAYAGEEQIGANWYAFNRIVDGNGGSLEEIYEFCQRELRQIVDINDDVSGDAYGTIKGVLAVPLNTFLGDTLQSNPGMLVKNFDIDDLNRIQMFDITVDGGGVDSEGKPVTTTARLYPFVSTGKLVFNQEILDDPDVEYRMYFDNVPAGDYDTVDAVVVNDADGNPIEGADPSGDVSFTFDYDNNEQGGRTKKEPAVVDVVAIGKSGAQFVVAQFTITAAAGLTFPVNAAKERNYSNPD